MIVVMKANATADDVQRVVERIGELGLVPHLSKGEFRTIVGAIGQKTPPTLEQLRQLPAVDEVLAITQPYKLASREFHEADTILDIKGIRVGGPHVNVIAGPCAIEGRDMLFEIARAVKDAGASMLRGGAFKPRTSPYAFTGMGREGLRLLQEVGRELSMPTITEVTDPRDVPLVYDHADIFQIGARNMQNFNLLLEVGRTDKPVFIKRGLAASINELLMSAEYVLSQGNHRVMVCERGLRTFADETRFTLDVSAVPVIQERSHLPVFVDPSHAAGKRDLVPALALAAIAAGAAGIIVEVHSCPDRALCDGPQAVLPANFARMMQQLRQIAEIVGHRVTLWNRDDAPPARPTTTGWMS
ncbi:MAG TPA: 3-deoxy-7-phosphoheptulonate synthase [Phycisphaerae bacterium]|nr:3-deoxy-7-phosphoheptulonate synthase [Phycisphaerae bacterium]HNU46495.1 3-deoxy-7-phosphoheptulonate synthase [Phycisphaerae bacterium]